MTPRSAGIARFLVAFGAATFIAAPSTGAAQAGTNAMHMPPGVSERALENGTKALVDAKGMTLYTYQRDTSAGKSSCNGRCADNWPPLMAQDNAMTMGNWSVVTRDDGKKMWAYKGKPLYTFARDTKPGDATGDGAGTGAWKVATP